MSSFSFGAIYCPLRGLYWLGSSPMISGGFYAGASPRRSLRPKGIDLRGRWFAPAQNTLASTATHRQTNDSKNCYRLYVGLPTCPLRGLFWGLFLCRNKDKRAKTARFRNVAEGNISRLRDAQAFHAAVKRPPYFTFARQRIHFTVSAACRACPSARCAVFFAWFVDRQARSNICRLVARCAVLYYVRASGQINTRF